MPNEMKPVKQIALKDDLSNVERNDFVRLIGTFTHSITGMSLAVSDSDSTNKSLVFNSEIIDAESEEGKMMIGVKKDIYLPLKDTVRWKLVIGLDAIRGEEVSGKTINAADYVGRKVKITWHDREYTNNAGEKKFANEPKAWMAFGKPNAPATVEPAAPAKGKAKAAEPATEDEGEFTV